MKSTQLLLNFCSKSNVMLSVLSSFTILATDNIAISPPLLQHRTTIFTPFKMLNLATGKSLSIAITISMLKFVANHQSTSDSPSHHPMINSRQLHHLVLTQRKPLPKIVTRTSSFTHWVLKMSNFSLSNFEPPKTVNVSFHCTLSNPLYQHSQCLLMLPLPHTPQAPMISTYNLPKSKVLINLASPSSERTFSSQQKSC